MKKLLLLCLLIVLSPSPAASYIQLVTLPTRDSVAARQA